MNITDFDKVVWVRQIDPECDYKIAVCGHSGRICRITHFVDCQPQLYLPVDRTPLEIKDGECNCSSWCMDRDCDLNKFDACEFVKHYDINLRKYEFSWDFGSRTFYFNYHSVNLIDLSKFFLFPNFPQEHQEAMFEIIKEEKM